MRRWGLGCLLLVIPACAPSAPPESPATSPARAEAVRAPDGLGDVGLSAGRPPVTAPLPSILAWHTVEDLPAPLAQMETVFWEPDDTVSLRRLIRETDLVRGKRVLEIGTGTGLIALCCLQAGAAQVVATDINPQALVNAAHNAEALGLADRLELRLVDFRSPGAFSPLAEGERFDLILSNPPWENQTPRTIAEYALYDEQFQLLRSLLGGLRLHLAPGGRAYLAYGCREAIRQLHHHAALEGLHVKILDDRALSSLPEVFLPGLLLEVSVESVDAESATLPPGTASPVPPAP
jgi:release factor glutamine methyltransferase